MRIRLRVLSLLAGLAALAGVVTVLRSRAASDDALLEPPMPAPPLPPVGGGSRGPGSASPSCCRSSSAGPVMAWVDRRGMAAATAGTSPFMEKG